MMAGLLQRLNHSHGMAPVIGGHAGKKTLLGRSSQDSRDQRCLGSGQRCICSPNRCREASPQGGKELSGPIKGQVGYFRSSHQSDLAQLK